MNILETEKTPLDIFCEASEILNEAVAHTLGPNGTNTAIQNKNGHYEIINDGKSIIETITSLDPAIAPALETLKQASFETNKKAGDGTTSTTILMNSLLHGARKYLNTIHEGLSVQIDLFDLIDSKSNYYKITPVDLRNTLLKIKDALLLKLDENRIEITEEDYEKVATVALGDDKYSKIIADTYKFLGKGRRPTLIKSDTSNIEVEKIDGISLTKTSMVSNLFNNTTEHHDIDVICLFSPVNRFQEMTQFLRKVQQSGRETILFYNQLSSDILENILFNYTNGAIKLIPISLQGYGKGTYSVMTELADYCECSIIDNNEFKISDVNKITLGKIDYSVINSDQVILKKNSKKLEKNYLHLDEKSIIIHIGGTNILEREEVYRRIEDAINSLGNAIDYGIVPGAGVTYSNLLNLVLNDENINIEIPDFVKTSMNLIRKTINASDTSNIYDSAMVTKEVIENAFTIVSQVITTHVVIHDNIR
jgi:chaperonin GroEL